MIRLFLLLIILTFLNACQAAKDGLTQKKRTTADEFLVEKKNPLILPPDYGNLPSPENNKTKVKSGEVNDIQNLLNKDVTTAKKSTQTNGTSSVENSILKKIKDK